MPLYHQLLTTTCSELTHHTSTTSHFWSLPGSTHCRTPQPTRRSRHNVVILRPYFSPDPAGPKYEQYCHQSLMQHRCFRQMDNLLAGSESYIDACAAFLQSGIIPPRLEDDVYRLRQHTSQDAEESSDTEMCSYEFCIPTPKLFLHCLTYTCAYPYTGAGQ